MRRLYVAGMAAAGVAIIAEEGAGRYTGGLFTATRLSIENVGKMPVTNLSVKYKSSPESEKNVAASDFVERMGLGSKAYFYPELSGGSAQ